MNEPDLYFVVPTHRLRDVGQTIKEYDHHFWRNGHSPAMIVFDDSTPANVDKYFDQLKSVKTHCDLFYVGPQQKEQFLSYISSRLRNKRLEPLVRNLFRPSYGGNRNYTLMYTLGGLMISSDDDMRPYSLMEDSPESLEENEVSRGRLHRLGENGYRKKSFDIMSAFLDVLGKPASEAPENYERGELLIDSAMDLETNASRGLALENAMMLQRGQVSDDAVVKMAQTFRSGTNDIDALDYVDMYLENEEQLSPDDLNDLYVLVNFRPVLTNKNWRMDCGVAGYDNTFGLPPFFPTRLRFEDYIYRLWIQQDGIVTAHTDAAQTHVKNNYMRSPLAMDVFNEEICTLLKKKIKASLESVDDLSIRFDYEGEVSLQDSEEILERIATVHARVLKAADTTKIPERKQALLLFAETLARSFYGFEPDFFQQNVSRIVDDVISQIHASLEIWPTLVEICYFHKDKREFPALKVQNKKVKRRNGATG